MSPCGPTVWRSRRSALPWWARHYAAPDRVVKTAPLRVSMTALFNKLAQEMRDAIRPALRGAATVQGHGHRLEQALKETLEQCVLADKVGFDNLWFVEHHFLTGFSG